MKARTSSVSPITLIGSLRATSSQKTQVSNSTVPHVDVQKRTVLLTAEDVGVAGAAARKPAIHRELDCQGRVEFDVVRDLRCIDAEESADRFARQDAAVADPVIGGAVGEDHVERDLVDAGVLAADRLCDLRQSAAPRHTPASTMKVGNNSSGSSSRIVWFIVQR